MLDIDMDFFQNDIHTNDVDTDEFLENSAIKVWDEFEFIHFLEEKCCLSTKKKVKGCVVKHHVEVFSYWKQLIDNNRLECPFKVTHIDAHSDLGFSPSIEFNKFVNSIKEQTNADIFSNNSEYLKLLNSGNFLLCAVFEDMISEIDYIFHNKLNELDVMYSDFKCIVPNKKFRFNQNNKIYDKNIQLNAIDQKEFKINEPIEYITVAISPSFVKKETCELVEIIKNYIDFDLY